MVAIPLVGGLMPWGGPSQGWTRGMEDSSLEASHRFSPLFVGKELLVLFFGLFSPHQPDRPCLHLYQFHPWPPKRGGNREGAALPPWVLPKISQWKRGLEQESQDAPAPRQEQTGSLTGHIGSPMTR